MWGITAVLLKWVDISWQDCVLLPIWWNHQGQCKALLSFSSKSALPATGTHSQCQQEFPGPGFITTCLYSQAHNTEGEGWGGCLNHEEWRKTSAVWGVLYQPLIQTVLPVLYSEAQVEQEPFFSISQPSGKWMRSQGIPWTARVLRKSHKLRTNVRHLLLRFSHVPWWSWLASPVVPTRAFLAQEPHGSSILCT